MANLIYPTEGLKGQKLAVDPGIPFIVGNDGAYIRGVNLYLQARCSGRVLLTGSVETVRVLRLSKNTIHAVGHRLTNFISWLYTEAAHPTEGIMNWRAVQEWHVQELYREAMVLGLWTEEYWWTGQRPSLNFAGTIGPRIKEVLACYRWMEAQGLIDEFEARATFQDKQSARSEAIAALKFALPPVLRNFPKNRKFHRRKDPGNWAPLTKDELKTILACVKLNAVRHAIVLYFMTGQRLAELLDNTLLPGTWHKRTAYELEKARYREEPYLLAYDNRDSDMVGVIPSMEAVFDPKAPKLLAYRIIGKNKKIRTVWLLSSFLKKLWKYRLVTKSTPEFTSKLLLNTQGRPLTPRTVEYHLQKARVAAEGVLGHSIPVTPHVLRHTFACYFLEANIAARASADRHDPEKLSRKQIEEYGGDVLPILQELLGHALLEDTIKYLRQLTNGRLGLQYLKVFSNIVEEVNGDEI